jgi:ferritin
MKRQSDEERGHALQFIDYITMRGGKVRLFELARPKPEEPTSPLHAFELALAFEKEVTTKLEELMVLGGEEKDPDLEHFIEHFIEEQKKSVRELSDHIVNIRRCGDGFGLYAYDKSLQ